MHRNAKQQGNGLRAKQWDISGHAVRSDSGHMSGKTQGIWLLVGVASFYKVQDKEKFDCQGIQRCWFFLLTDRLGLGKPLFIAYVPFHDTSDFNFVHSQLCIGIDCKYRIHSLNFIESLPYCECIQNQLRPDQPMSLGLRMCSRTCLNRCQLL